MGLSRVADIKDHWSTSSIFHNPLFAKQMSRDRFLQILQTLSFKYETSKNDESPRGKFYILIDAVLLISKKHYKPSQHLALDETMIALDEPMIAFKGRHLYKVLFPS